MGAGISDGGGVTTGAGCVSNALIGSATGLPAIALFSFFAKFIVGFVGFIVVRKTVPLMRTLTKAQVTNARRGVPNQNRHQCCSVVGRVFNRRATSPCNKRRVDGCISSGAPASAFRFFAKARSSFSMRRSLGIVND